MPTSFKIFEPLASAFRLTTPFTTEGWTRTPLSMGCFNWAGKSESFGLPDLWHRQDSNLSLTAFQKKLALWMDNLGIPASEGCVAPVIGMIAMMVEGGSSLTAALTEIQNSLRQMDVTYTFVLPHLHGEGWNGCLTWEGFRFERLDAAKLVYRCNKAKALTLAMFAGKLDSAPSFASPVFRRPLLDLAEVCWRLKTAAIQRYGDKILEAHLQGTSDSHQNAMWQAIEDAFLLPNALGVHLFNFAQLRWLAGAEIWTFYTGLGPGEKFSWVGKQVVMLPLKTPSFGEAQPVLARLAKNYQFDRIRKSKLYPLLQNVSRSLIRSRNHLVGQRVDESFLFLIIAIEQVFSEKENTTQAVTRRTAIVVHRQLNMDYASASKHVGALYDVRSRLVHQGKPVTRQHRSAANSLGGVVVRSIMRLCLLPDAENDGFRERWLKRLDLLVAGIEAEKPPSPGELTENGIMDRVCEQEVVFENFED
jgi:hypothetical protein